MDRDIKVHSRYSVFKVWDRVNGYTWSLDGRATQNTMGTYATHAVRVLCLWGTDAMSINGQGKLEVIPVAAFGARIPDTKFLPGNDILIDGKPYSVETASDEVVQLDSFRAVAYYEVRARKGTRSTQLVVADWGDWYFGAACRPVKVVGAR